MPGRPLFVDICIVHKEGVPSQAHRRNVRERKVYVSVYVCICRRVWRHGLGRSSRERYCKMLMLRLDWIGLKRMGWDGMGWGKGEQGKKAALWHACASEGS